MTAAGAAQPKASGRGRALRRDRAPGQDPALGENRALREDVALRHDVALGRNLALGQNFALRQDLHQLSQPLTRLQWRLELGLRAGAEAELREAIAGALADSAELIEWIHRLRIRIEEAGERA